MNYVKFGNSGLDISRIYLGFGDITTGFNTWTSDIRCIRFKYQFFDTASYIVKQVDKRLVNDKTSEWDMLKF